MWGRRASVRRYGRKCYDHSYSSWAYFFGKRLQPKLRRLALAPRPPTMPLLLWLAAEQHIMNMMMEHLRPDRRMRKEGGALRLFDSRYDIQERCDHVQSMWREFHAAALACRVTLPTPPAIPTSGNCSLDLLAHKLRLLFPGHLSVLLAIPQLFR